MIHVKWGRDVLHIPFPPPDTLLGALRAELAEYTHLPPGSFKLVYKGAVMKEDGVPLSTYKLKENATIALIGGDVLEEGGDRKRASGGGIATTTTGTRTRANGGGGVTSPTEQGTIMAIQAELEKVRGELVPDVDRFVGALDVAGASASAGVGAGVGVGVGVDEGKRPTPTRLDHSRLSELLLQSLLRLDALFVPGMDWPEARVQRKAAVREVQGVLDRLDGAWAAR